MNSSPAQSNSSKTLDDASYPGERKTSNLIKPHSLSLYARLRPFITFALILGVVIAIQAWQGALNRDFASDPDEAGHFVTGAMVYDFLASGLRQSPLSFAEDYYAHYPKVGLGHWPPGFYVLQALWYVFFGLSKQSATMLVGLLAAVLAWCLYRDLARRHSSLIVVMTLVVFFGQPLIRNQIMLIMSDLPTSLATLLAAFAFRDLADQQKARHVTTFVFWSSFAILLKPSAFSIALFAPIYLVLTGRCAALKSWHLWLAGAAIGIFTAPWYIWVWNSGIGLHSQGSLVVVFAKAIAWFTEYSFAGLLAIALGVAFYAVISGRYAILTNRKLWLAGAVFGLFVAAWYFRTGDPTLAAHSDHSFTNMIAHAREGGANPRVLPALNKTLSWPLISVALFGTLLVLRASRGDSTVLRQRHNDGSVAIALSAATMIFIAAAPVGPAPRYFLPLLLGSLILFAIGAEGISDMLQNLFRQKSLARGVSIIATGSLCLVATVITPGVDKPPKHIYSNASRNISKPVPGRVILISSDSRGGGAIGEGAFIVERLLNDRERIEFTLRASKVLATSKWSGDDYHTKFSTAEGVRDFLESTPVHLIVIDDFEQQHEPAVLHHQLLKTVVTASPDRFPLVFQSPPEFSRRNGNSLRIYSNIAADGHSLSNFSIDMDRSLGKTIPVRAQSSTVRPTE